MNIGKVDIIGAQITSTANKVLNEWDNYLVGKEYREAVLPGMNYVIIFRIDETEVYVLGVFHELEQYRNKM